MTGNEFILIILIAILLITVIVSILSEKEEKSITKILVSSGMTLVMSGIPGLSEMILGIVSSLLNVSLLDAEGSYGNTA